MDEKHFRRTVHFKVQIFLLIRPFEFVLFNWVATCSSGVGLAHLKYLAFGLQIKILKPNAALLQ